MCSYIPTNLLILLFFSPNSVYLRNPGDPETTVLEQTLKTDVSLKKLQSEGEQKADNKLAESEEEKTKEAAAEKSTVKKPEQQEGSKPREEDVEDEEEEEEEEEEEVEEEEEEEEEIEEKSVEAEDEENEEQQCEQETDRKFTRDEENEQDTMVSPRQSSTEKLQFVENLNIAETESESKTTGSTRIEHSEKPSVPPQTYLWEEVKKSKEQVSDVRYRPISLAKVQLLL